MKNPILHLGLHLGLSLGASLAPFVLATAVAAQTPAEPAAVGVEDAKIEVGSPLMLRLFDGSILWGKIAGHDAEALEFARLDNGGRVRVPWARLDPSQADQLLERFGYVDHSSEELMIEADRLELSGGGDVIGLIVNRTEDDLLVKTAKAVVPVPKARIRGASTRVQVPALEVYTREELYQQGLSQLDPQSPQSQLDMAVYCEKILDSAHAVEHYQAAAALDPSFKPAELKVALERARTRAQNQAQLDYLHEVDVLKKRGRYDEALARAEAFTELFPESPLRADAAKKKQQVLKERELALRKEVVNLWHSWAGRFAHDVARQAEPSLDAAIAWIDDGMSEAVLAAVTDELRRRVSPSVEPDLVRRYWTERGQKGETVKARNATYGQGTWLLGEDEARAGLEEETPEGEKLKGDKSSERARLNERIKRYLANQAAVKKSKANADDEGELAKFWKEWTSQGRAQWILAYYAEKGGDMQVLKVRGTPCRDCNGDGVREVAGLIPASNQPNQAGGRGGQGQGSAGPGNGLVKCPTCHHVGIVRSVRYR
jgi:tetratricopeptide (TPR) repeat protein